MIAAAFRPEISPNFALDLIASLRQSKPSS
jgi:hypothetical protein